MKNTIVLELKYSNASGRNEEMLVEIVNDLDLDEQAVLALFESYDWTTFNAYQFALPSPAHYIFEWQADGEDHCFADLTEIYYGQQVRADTKADAPLSVIAEYLKAGGEPGFEEASKAALKAEHARLSALLDITHDIVIVVDSDQRVASVITEDEDLKLQCIVMDTSVEDRSCLHDVGVDWHGTRTWVYNFASYAGTQKVLYAKVMDDLYLNYELGTHFSFEGDYLNVTEPDGETFMERVSVSPELDQSKREMMTTSLNVFDW